MLLHPALLESQVDASPRSSKSPRQLYPRVTGLASKEIEDRVNMLLANAEKQDLADRRDCLQFRLPGIRPGFSEKIKVTYLSPRLLSIDIRYSDFGCSEHQNLDTLRPMTIDLVHGEVLDWKLFFKDEFLRFEEGGSLLTRLYLRRARPRNWCTQVLTADEGEFEMWLDRRHGLMVQPLLSRRSSACAELMSIPFKKLQNAIRDPELQQEILQPKH
jgi:hypothetical protein